MKLAKPIYFALLIISCVITFFYYENRMKEEEARNVVLQQSYIERIKLAITSVAQPISGFDRASKIYHHNITDEEFRILAEVMYDPETHIAISYSPAGVTTHVYPFEENKAVIGHDILNSTLTRKEALKTIASKKTTMSGPYPLIQGNKSGIVIRNPVFGMNNDQEEFWGFISLVIASPNFLSVTGLLNLSNLNYELSLLGFHNGENVPIWESANFAIGNAPYEEFEIYNSPWKFSIYRPGEFSRIFQQSLWLLGTLITVSSVLYHIISYLELRNLSYKQQIVKDKLTDAYSRTYLDEYRFNQSYSLFYIDLNKFKPVNDTYGHEVGDKLLQSYVLRLREHFKKDTPIIRMGGDEFLVVVNEVLTKKDIAHIKTRIENLSAQPFKVERHILEIGASVGCATYPYHGDNLEELIKHADEEMYKVKRAR